MSVPTNPLGRCVLANSTKFRSGNSVYYRKPFWAWKLTKRKGRKSWDRTLNVFAAENLLRGWHEGEFWNTFQERQYNLLELRSAHQYAEPGYTLGEGKLGILFGNWNRLSKNGYELLEEHFDLEWCDEWFTCDECGKAIRHQADDMSWSPSYQVFDGSCACAECLANDPHSYLCSVAWDLDKGEPEEYPSYSILRECKVFSGEGIPEGWEILEDPLSGRYGIPNDKETAETLLSQGYEKVMLYKLRSYEYKLILGYKDPDREEDEESDEEE